MSEIKTQSFQEFIKETFSDEFLQETAIEYTLAQIAGRAYEARKKSGLSFCKIVDKMGLCSQEMVQQIIDTEELGSIRISDLVRFSHACGFDLNVEFIPKR